MNASAPALPTTDQPTQPGLIWLVRLRWLALAAQAFTVLVTALWLPVPLNLPVLVGCLAFTGVTNLFVILLRTRWPLPDDVPSATLLALDTLTLTLMLGAAGGAFNPFTSFYLLQVALAALLLPQTLSLIVMGLAAVGYTLLYVGAPEFCGLGPATGSIPPELHFQGMFAALGLTSLCIAYFVGRLQNELRRSEAGLHESRLRNVRQERFVSLATLAAGVAHELATPLGTIAVVSREFEQVACHQCLNGACRDDARLIRSEVERCRSIIDRLNAGSAAGPGEEAEWIELSDLPAALTGFLLPAHAARLKVEVVPVGSTVLPAPRIPLLQALAVLVKNACEADPSGSEVEFRIESGQSSTIFTVTDHGPGIAAACASRLGEPFFTTKAPGEGMGLGLYIVRMLAERLHGRLDFVSSASAGAVVTLTLPRQRGRDLHES